MGLVNTGGITGQVRNLLKSRGQLKRSLALNTPLEMAVRATVESLEIRRLLSSGTPITLTGDSGATSFYIRRSGDNVQIFQNQPITSVPLISVPVSNDDPIIIVNTSGSDTVTVDYSGGDPIAAGLSFAENGAALSSYLVVTNTGGAAYNLSSASDTLAISNSQFNDTISLGYFRNMDLFGGGGSSQLNILNGSFGFSNDFAEFGASVDVNVAANSGISFSTVEHLHSLNIAATGKATVAKLSGQVVLDTDTLTVNGTLNLTNNDLIVNAPSPADMTTLQAAVAAGYGGISGPRTIYSSSAAADGMVIGVAPATDVTYPSYEDSSQPLTLDGQVVPSTALVARYTLAGDTNLDGIVNINDFLNLTSHYNQHFGLTPPAWYDGDFDYSGTVNLFDFNALVANFNLGINAQSASATVGQPLTIDIPIAGPTGNVFNTIDVDWGDGNIDTYQGGTTTAEHTYTTAGAALVQMTGIYNQGSYHEPATSVIITDATGLLAWSPTPGSIHPADNINISSDGNGNTTISDNGSVIESVATADLLSLNISGDTSGTLTADFSQGNPLPPSGLFADSRTINVIGSTASDTLLTATTTAIFAPGSTAGFDQAEIRHPASSAVTFENAGPGDNLIAVGGTVTLAGDLSNNGAGSNNGGPVVTVNTFANVLFTGNQHLSSLDVLPGGTARMVKYGGYVLETSALNLQSDDEHDGGLLDLADNDLIVRNGDINAIADLLYNGYGAGYSFGAGLWSDTSGRAGIDSTTALADPVGVETLGYAEVGDAVGELPVTIFDGQSVNPGDVVVKFTYNGDSNLDGSVNAADRTLTNFGFATSLTGWTLGDFNYDGVVNSTDLTLMSAAERPNLPPGSLHLAAGSSLGLATFPTTTPAGQAITSWLFDWGNGQTQTLSPSSTPTIPYGSANATYLATFIPLDAHGNAEYYYPHTTISVGSPSEPGTDVPVTLQAIANQTVNTGTSLSVSTSFIDTGTGQSHVATIYWGDGTTSTASLGESGGMGVIWASHTYQSHGSYTATLQVTDSGGGVAANSFGVTALYVAPTVSVVLPLNPPVAGQAAQYYTLNYQGPETSTVSSWTVDWGDGDVQTITSPPTRSFTNKVQWLVPHTYEASGTFTITATAYDFSGAYQAPPTLVSVGTPLHADVAVFLLPVGGENVVVNGDAGADRFYVRWFDGDLQIFDNSAPASPTDPGDPIYSAPASGLNGVTINGGGGEDRLTVDYTNVTSVNSVLPFGFAGLRFNGGTNSIPDPVTLVGGSAGSTVSDPDEVTVDGSEAQSTISFTAQVVGENYAGANIFATNSLLGLNMNAGDFTLQAKDSANPTIYSSSINIQGLDVESSSTITIANDSVQAIPNVSTETGGTIAYDPPSLPVSSGPLTIDSLHPIRSGGIDFTGTELTIMGPSDNLTHTITVTGNSLTIDGATVHYFPGTIVTFHPGASTTALNVDGGIADISSDVPTLPSQLKVEVSAGGSVEFDSTLHLSQLTINPGGTARMHEAGNDDLVIASGLSVISPTGGLNGGMLDLADNDLILQGGSLAATFTLLAAGYDDGAWDGNVSDSLPAPASIVSSLAALDQTDDEALGVGQIGQAGAPAAGYFDNLPVGNGDVVVKFTYYGDANLDAAVTAADYGSTDTGINHHLTGWTNGDFNYDGQVDSSDFTLLDNAYNTVLGLPSFTVTAGNAFPTGQLPTVTPGTDVPIKGWQVNWGNGTSATFAPGASIPNPYGNSAASYLATFIALDANGNPEYYFPHTSVLIATAISVTISGSPTASPGTPYTLGFSAVGIAHSQITGWTINWGDGNTSSAGGSATSATHTYHTTGLYDPQVTVNTAIGNFTSAAFGLNSTYGTGGIATALGLTHADAIASQPSGQIVVLDTTLGLLERLNTDGSVDHTFGSDGLVKIGIPSLSNSLKIDNSGNILVAGMRSNDIVIDRFTPDGLPDVTFNGTGETSAVSNVPIDVVAAGMSLLLNQTNNTILLTFASGGAFEVVSILAKGAIDPNAGTGQSGITTTASVSLKSGSALQSAMAQDGSIIVAGMTATGSVIEQITTSNSHQTPVLDPHFNAGAALVLQGSVTALASSGAGDIFIGSTNSTGQSTITKLSANGTVDQTFGAEGTVVLPTKIIKGNVSTLTVTASGDVIVSGTFGSSIGLAHYNADGSRDSTFGANGFLTVALSNSQPISSARMLVHSDGSIFVATSLVDGGNFVGEVVKVNPTNAIAAQPSLSIAPYELPATIHAGTGVSVTALGADPSDTLNWSEYANGLLVESYQAIVADDGVQAGFIDPNPGQYEVDVTSSSGARASYSFSVVANSPTVYLSGPLGATAGGVVVMIANASHNPAPRIDDPTGATNAQFGPGATVSAQLTYSWTVSFIASSTSTHVLFDTETPTNLSSLYFVTGSSPGQYVVTVNVNSSDGGSPASASRTVTVVDSTSGSGATPNPTQTITPISPLDFGMAHSVLIQPDGKILVAGIALSDVGGMERSYFIAIARYNSSGTTLDGSFGNNGIEQIGLLFPFAEEPPTSVANVLEYCQTPIALESNGDIVVGAWDGDGFASNGSPATSTSELFMLAPNGQLDSSFGVLPDGESGNGLTSTEFTQQSINPSSIDNGPIESSGVLGIVTLEDGDLVTDQVLYDHGIGKGYWALVRYHPDGTIDSTFGPNGNGIAVADTSVVGGAQSADPWSLPSRLSLAVNPVNGAYVLAGPISVSASLGGGFFGFSLQSGMVMFSAAGDMITSGFGNMGTSAPGWTLVPGLNSNEIGSTTVAISQILITFNNGTPYIVAGGTSVSGDGSDTEAFFIGEYDLTGQLNQSFGQYGSVTQLINGTTNQLEDMTLLSDGSILAVGDSNRPYGDFLNTEGAETGSPDVDVLELNSQGGNLQANTFRLSYPMNGLYMTNSSLVCGVAAEGGHWIIVGGAQDPGYSDTWGSSEFLVLNFDPQVYGATQLTATAAPDGTINLNWLASGDSSVAFEILRRTDPSQPFQVIGATAIGAATYTDSTVAADTTYYYKVGAITPQGVKGISNIASASTPAANQGYLYLGTVTVSIFGDVTQSSVSLTAGMPYLLVATGNISQTADGAHRGDAEYGYYPAGGVTNWWLNNPYSGAMYGYEYGVSVGQDPTDLNGFYTKAPFWGPLASDSNHTYSIVYTPGSTGPLYANYHDIYYADNALNSGDIALQVAIYAPLPPTPDQLVAQSNLTARGIKLSWDVPVATWESGASHLLVQRSSDGGKTFSTVATLAGGQQSWLDNTVAPNTSYTYRIINQVGTAQSRPSNLAAAVLSIDPPQIQPILAQVALRDVSFAIQVHATDSQFPLDPLTYSLSATGTGLTVSSTGLIGGWTPTQDDSGSYTLTLTAKNVAGVSNSISFLVTVPSGASPIYASTPSITPLGGSRYRLTISASEAGVDASDLFYTWASVLAPDSSGPPPTPAFSPQGTSEAGNCVVTLFSPGDYYFQATITDSLGNVQESSSVHCSASPVLTSLAISPTVSFETGGFQQQLSIQGLDQFGQSIQTPSNVFWAVTTRSSSNIGSVGQTTGIFTPGSAPGTITVQASVGAGSSLVSGTTTINVSGLSAPSNLTPSNLQSSSVDLSWSPSAGSALVGYDVRESLSQTGPFITALDGSLVTGSGSTIEKTISVVPGITYYFEIVAEDNNRIDSPPSAVISVAVKKEDTLPPAPTGLVAGVAAVNYAGTTRVALNWSAIAGLQLLGYDVYRSSTPNFVPNSQNLIGSSVDNEYVDDSSLTSGAYYYLVEAANDAGDSAPSNQASADLSGPIFAPSAPTNVASVVSSVTSSVATVQVTWTDVSKDETEFIIERSTGSNTGPWTQAGVVATNVTSFTDTLSSLGTATYYEITAVNTAGEATSAPSSGIQGSPPVASGVVLVPAHPSVATNGTDQITPEVVDQYGNPMPTQPSSFTWTLGSGGAGGSVSSSGLYTAPATLSITTDGQLLDQDVVQAAADGFTGQITITTIKPQPPVAKITSVSSSTAPQLLTKDTEVDGIVDDLGLDLASWTLTATPVAGGGAITLATGTSNVGAAPSQSGVLGTIHVASMPDGTYTLTLTATDQGDSAFSTSVNVLVQIQSQLKLGNLTLPFTDLTVNAPSGQSIPITRTYDSSQANIATSTGYNMGYGWTLNVTSTDLRSTVPAQNGTNQPAGYQDGNLLYITTPDGAEHIFEFLAKPTGNFADNPLAGLIGKIETYYPQFVCVDGSGARLKLVGSDGTTDISTKFTLVQDAGRYIDVSTNGNWFNPDNFRFGMQYRLVSADGTSYLADPASGQLKSSTDTNGIVTYYAPGNAPYDVNTTNGIVTSVSDHAGQYVQYYYDAFGNLIGTIDASHANTTYLYGDQLLVPNTTSQTVYAQITDSSDNKVWSTSAGWISYDPSNPGQFRVPLTAIDDASNNVQWYAYADTSHNLAIAPGTAVSISFYGSGSLIATQTRTWSAPHLLSGIIDSNKVTVLTAAYDSSTNLLTSLINTMHQSSGVQTGGFNGTSADQITTDVAGNATEEIFDQYGDVTRKIQTIKDSVGNITGFLVTVSSYSYYNTQNSDAAALGIDLLNIPRNQVTYAPFEVPGVDSYGLRYSEAPPTPPQQIITYYEWNGDDNSLAQPQIGKPEMEMTLIGPAAVGGHYLYNLTQIPIYLPNSTVFNYDQFGHPQLTQNYIATTDASGNVLTSGGNPIEQPVSSTSSQYDSAGNLISSTDATGLTTYYWYSGESTSTGGANDPFAGNPVLDVNTAGLNAGLLVYTFRKTSNGTPFLLSSNGYYSSNTPGAAANQLASTTTYNYTSTDITNPQSQKTYSYYDDMGNLVLTAVYKSWTSTSGSTAYGWTASATDYDILGRSVSTWQATYVDGSTNNPRPLNITVTQAAAATGTSPAVNSHATVGQTPSTYLPIGSTTYTSDGQTQSTTDQYNGTTTNTYDASGHLVRTLYPDGTEVRSVYNQLGQVIWQTGRYATTTLANDSDDNTTTANATETIYNSLGQVVSMERFTGVLIMLGADPFAPTNSALKETTLKNPSDPGILISTTTSIYNGAGQMVETDSPSGLRTGTVYYPGGSVEYTGPLKASASSSWYLSANPAGSFASYTSSLNNQVDTSGGNLWSGLIYNQTIDALGNATRTYNDQVGDTTDQVGTVAFTVFADGTFTQSIASIGDQPILFDPSMNHLLPSGLSAPSGLFIPAGGHESISIAQRSGTDQLLATFDVYDSAGNLVDVYLPPVVDGSTTNTTKVSPHWHYDYDASGDEIDQISPYGSAYTTSFTYDANGNKISQTMPDGEKQTWAYDQYGNQILHKVYGQTTYSTNGWATSTTYDVYDTSPNHGGRFVTEYRFSRDVNPSGTNPSDWTEMTNYSYDDSLNLAAGQLGTGGVLTVNDYVAATSTTMPITSTSYTYDPSTGKEASITTPEGTVNYAYDQATGELIETWTGTAGKASAGTDTLYGYDNQGRLESVSEVRLNGQSVVLAALPANSQTRYDADGNAVQTYDPTITYTYDADGNLFTETDPNGQVTTYQFDTLNRLMLETVKVNGQLAETMDYDQVLASDQIGGSQNANLMISDSGQRLGEVDTRYINGALFSQVQYQWTYDYDNRLASETLTVDSGGSNTPTPYADAFRYDLDNNRVSEKITGGDTISYAYNPDDQLLTETEIAYGGGTVYLISYTYDDFGNLKTEIGTGSKATTNTYTYDLRNRMTKAVINGTETDDGYDTAGVLVSETTNAGTNSAATTYYLNDPNNPTGYTKTIEDKSGTSLSSLSTIRSYELGLKVEAQSDATNGTLYLVTDGHGSTTMVVNTGGQIIESYSYDAYGKMLLAQHFAYSGGTPTITTITSLPTATTWLFGGDGVYDPATGWTYHLARWTNGFWFTQADGDGYANNADPISLHKYLYAGANPISYADPSGHDLTELLVSVGVLGTLGATIGGIAGGVLFHATGGGVLQGILAGALGGSALGVAFAEGPIEFGKAIGIGLTDAVIFSAAEGLAEWALHPNNFTPDKGEIGRQAFAGFATGAASIAYGDYIAEKLGSDDDAGLIAAGTTAIETFFTSLAEPDPNATWLKKFAEAGVSAGIDAAITFVVVHRGIDDIDVTAKTKIGKVIEAGLLQVGNELVSLFAGTGGQALARDLQDSSN